LLPTDVAIAAVTLALKQRLQVALNRSGVGGEVRTDKPDKLTDTASPVVNLYLYFATINPFMRNNDLEPELVRDPGGKTGELVRTWRTPLSLQYLLSFYGDERTLVPQRLMSVCIAALHRTPLIAAKAILAGAQAAAAEPGGAPDLDGVEDVTLTFMPLPLDDAYRLWSAFKAPYALSICYEAGTAIVASEPQTAPVDLVEDVDLRIKLPPPPPPPPPAQPPTT
jgi:hypothetical protein